MPVFRSRHGEIIGNVDIYGTRGTDDLDLNRQPRKMRGRVQPYRRRKPRPPGPTLDAILRGEGIYGNPGDFTRQRQKVLKRMYGRGISG